MTTETFRPLSTLWRCYIYAIHGYVIEIMFTAAWEFVVHMNWKFPGNTSVWSLPIYGLSTLVVEQIYFATREKMPLPARAMIYTVWTYLCEFSAGYILKQFNACPWDYTAFHADFMGLVTLEYAPLWFLLAIVAEKVVISATLCLHWGPNTVEQNGVVQTSLDNGDVQKKKRH